MAWANLSGVLATFPAPGPSLYETDYYLGYLPIEAVSKTIPTYTEITPSDGNSFTVAPAANESWTAEADAMHSMQLEYFPHVTGVAAPTLPGTTKTGLPRTRLAAPR